jgi:hypothetical protein
LAFEDIFDVEREFGDGLKRQGGRDKRQWVVGETRMSLLGKINSGSRNRETENRQRESSINCVIF